MPTEPAPGADSIAIRAPIAETSINASLGAVPTEATYAPQPTPARAPAATSGDAAAQAAAANSAGAAAESAQPSREPAPTGVTQPQPGVPGPALRAEGQPASPAGADQAAAPPKPDTAPFTAFLSRGVGAVVRQGGGSLILRLDPPSLGQITIRLQMDGGAMQAQFDASTPQAHRLLHENLSSLRATLEARGMTVDRLEVATRSAGAAHQPTAQQPAEPGGAATQSSRAESDADASHGHNRGLRDGRSETGRRDDPHDQNGRGAPPRQPAAFDERLRLTFSATA